MPIADRSIIGSEKHSTTHGISAIKAGYVALCILPYLKYKKLNIIKEVQILSSKNGVFNLILTNIEKYWMYFRKELECLREFIPLSLHQSAYNPSQFTLLFYVRTENK